MELPQRQVLPHTPPAFVSSGAVYFLTVCGAQRGVNQFARDATWEVLRSSAEYLHQHGRWHLHILLAMPDHIHALASFPRHESMRAVVADWKRFVARKVGVEWQRDFFDHRIRNSHELAEKRSYVLENPVRGTLMNERVVWPFFWEPESRSTPSAGR